MQLIDDDAKEIFGAHTDASFTTIVPVAKVSGLEVYDEAEECWYRPELRAKRHYDQQRVSNEDDDSIPWYARYICIMPGEHLQIVTRNEISGCVHRVVASAAGSEPRYSAPVLLRGRPGVVLDTKRYLGSALGNKLLEECDGMTMEEIHSATQPSSN